MFVSRVFSRASRSVCRNALLTQKHQLPILANQLNSIVAESQSKLVTNQLSPLHRSAINSSALQQFCFSSSASTDQNDKEHRSNVENNVGSSSAEHTETKDDAKVSGEVVDATKESDSDAETELSVDDWKKLLLEKEELLVTKQKEIETMQDKFLRACAEMENARDRIKRDAENSKKFAIQSFAKYLLDVADNLGRASSVVKESFAKIDSSKDSSGAVPLLKTLLDGVEMTEKQLTEVLRKFGVEKFDPIHERFDPNKHNAVFQVPDGTRPPGIVAHVLKAGYTLYDRVIRPAEVGVTQEVEKNESENNSQNNEAQKDNAADKGSRA